MRFPSTRRERGGGKKERRESTRTRTRERARRVYVPACVCVHACARERCTERLHREETHVRAEGIERGSGEGQRRREKGGKRGRQGDGSCVCTTRRVYQATSVVTAIVPTTSPAGRYPRSIRLPFRRALPSLWRRVGFPPSPLILGSPWCFLPPRREGRDPTLPRAFLQLLCLKLPCFASFLFPIFNARSVFTSGRKVNF